MGEAEQTLDREGQSPLPLPASIRRIFWLCIALALGFIAWYVGSYFLQANDDEDLWSLSPSIHDSVRSNTLIIIAVFSLICAWLVQRRKRIAPKATLLVFTVAIATLIDELPVFPDYSESGLYSFIHESAPTLASWILSPGLRWLYFFTALALIWVIYGMCTRNKESVEWFRLKPFAISDDGGKGRSAKALRLVAALLLAAIAWWALRTVGLVGLISTSLFENFSFIDDSWVTDLVGLIDQLLPFTIAAAGLILFFERRSIVDSDGVRLALASPGWTLYNAPWKRVRRVDVVQRGTDAPVAVIHYRAKGWFPLSFPLKFERGAASEEQVRSLVEVSQSNGVRTQWQRVSDLLPYFAMLFVAVALLVHYYAFSRQELSWLAYCKLDSPPTDLAKIAAPEFYGAVTAIFASCFGVALGLMSAYHRAGPSPFFLVFYMIIMRWILPTPDISWFVWIAIYGILMARTGQGHAPPILPPTQHEWDVGLFLSDYAVPISAVAYVLAVVVAVRKPRSTMSLEPSPRPS